MTIHAVLCFLRAHGVREVRAERLATEALGGDCLLLAVNPFVLRGLGADEDSTRTANRRDFHVAYEIAFFIFNKLALLVFREAALYRAVDAQHEYVVAQSLKIVLRPVAARRALVVQVV